MPVIPLAVNPVVQSYIVYASILALKLLSVSLITGFLRLTRGIFANPEDVRTLGGRVKLDDPLVERARRAHLNDLENIPAFWILGALYVTTGPATAWATLLFRVYTNIFNILKILRKTMWLNEPAVQSYMFYSSILALKLLIMSILTGRVRHRKKAFANDEDAKISKGIVKFDDPDVERVKRAHLNDLENIPAFWLLGALYLMTSPTAEWATLLFRVYTVCRIVHTIVYAVKPLPQPARGIAYEIPNIIMWYMGINIVSHFKAAL